MMSNALEKLTHLSREANGILYFTAASYDNEIGINLYSNIYRHVTRKI